MNRTKIPYADFTWNPTLGCSRVSPGCENCYAERLASTRLRHLPAYEGLTCDGRWTGKVRLLPERLGEPTELRQGWTIFVGDMSDIFHPEVPFEFVAAIFGVMAACPQHVFLLLTKRPELMAQWFEWVGEEPFCEIWEHARDASPRLWGVMPEGSPPCDMRWPLPNVWLGATAEDQQRFDERVRSLKMCPAARYWMSLEPLLELIDWLDPLNGGIGQVVVGGEAGPRARPCNVEWIRSIREQCRGTGTACFVKQLGSCFVDEKNAIGGYQAKPPPEYGKLHRRLKSRSGSDVSEWPEDLRVRQWVDHHGLDNSQRHRQNQASGSQKEKR